MFKKLVKHLIFREKSDEATKNIKLDAAVQLMDKGDLHGAANAFREYLEIAPYDVKALNNLGACLMDVGNTREAAQAFELAYSLDDTYVPGIVNHARMCFENNQSKEGLEYLRQAKICSPHFTHVDTVYAAYCLKMGEVGLACHYQKKAWLANFDRMRYANCYLFYSAYHDISESILAMEHRFWGETVHPIELKANNPAKHLDQDQAVGRPDKKIKIGYWSPDMRNHSVRFFFRPLLENHDASKFETFVYHDGPVSDPQTELIEKASARFFRCYELSDDELSDLLLSHELDILVELAGHSSYNRITLMQRRFAPVQMTALGYPPTVGLPTIDVKVLDRHVVKADSSSYYTENPLALSNSFWCFDPLEDVPVTPEPPVIKNGYITFSCMGNVAKINQRMLRLWKVVFDQVPGCRLLIRSINFEDAEAEVAMRGHLVAAGIDLGMVDVCKPAGGSAFFGTYSEVDIILDTFPFNGGTTTCFATYMGVPVVSLSGQSLTSRMGLSILFNLGVQHLAVDSEEDYVARAVELASNKAFLQRFRQEARRLFKQTSLGNGQLFAQEFEEACRLLLEQKAFGAPALQSTVPVLPVDELVRRGYAVLSQDQPEAAKRILAHCLDHYPDSGSAQLLAAQLLVVDEDAAAGAAYLAARVNNFTLEEQVSALIAMTRWCMVAGQLEKARHWLDRVLAMPLEDDFDRWQVQLYEACCQAYEGRTDGGPPPRLVDSIQQPKHCRVLIVCDSESHFAAVSRQMAKSCILPEGWRVSYERCDESTRIEAYQSALSRNDADVLVLLQKKISIHGPSFFLDVVAGLQDCDILGFAGATRWQRMDWRTDEFDRKLAGFMVASSEVAGFCEIQWFGPRSGRVVGGMAVLDGSMLAMIPSRVRHVAFDEALLGAEQMVEEDWTYAAFEAGLRLSVNRSLGILLLKTDERDLRERTPALMSLLEKRGFDPFAVEKTDTMYVSASMPSVALAMQAMNGFSEQI